MSDKPVQDAVVSLIRTVQSEAMEGRFRDQLTLSRLISKPRDPGWESARMDLTFGYGYFDHSKVFIYLDDKPVGEAETEEAAAAYCESRLPAILPKG